MYDVMPCCRLAGGNLLILPGLQHMMRDKSTLVWYQTHDKNNGRKYKHYKVPIAIQDGAHTTPLAAVPAQLCLPSRPALGHLCTTQVL